MTRRGLALGLLAATFAGPAIAAEAAQRRRRSGAGGSSSSKPSVAERANRRVGRSTRSNTASAGKRKTEKAGDTIDAVLGRGRASR